MTTNIKYKQCRLLRHGAVIIGLIEEQYAEKGLTCEVKMNYGWQAGWKVDKVFDDIHPGIPNYEIKIV